MRELRTIGAANVLLVSLLAALSPMSAGAASFAVDSTLDGVDALPGDGVCATLAGDCTLRAAIQETNALPGADSVTLPAGLYALSLPGPADDLAATGDLDVTDDLTLTGAGAATTLVDAGGLDRVFQIGAPVRTPVVHISGLTLRNGFAAAGGGLSVASNASLTLEDSTVLDNQGGIGGGMANAGTVTVVRTTFSGNASETEGGGIDAPGETTVIDSRFEGNTAGGLGGAIAAPPGSALHVRGSTFTGNVASEGGALAAGVDLAGAGRGSEFTLTDSEVIANTSLTNGGGILSGGGAIEDCEIVDNVAGTDGGGIDNLGTLELTRTRVERNVSGVQAGGIASRAPAGALTLTDSAVVGNQSGANGGGITIGAPLMLIRSIVSQNSTATTGGGIASIRPATLIESTVSENRAGNLGGGISTSDVLVLIDSTVSGNSTDASGGGIAIAGPLIARNSTISGNRAASNGGGVSIISSPLSSLHNVTLSDNLADSDGDGTGNGGGVNVTAGSLSLANTIVAANSDAGGEAPDCSGVLTSQGHNLIGDPLGCSHQAGEGDIVGADPRLGPLADNGGPTQTHSLLAASPAIDAGNPDPSVPEACDPADQRGVARPQDGDGDGEAVCDIGAFELGAPTSTPGKVTGGGVIPGAQRHGAGGDDDGGESFGHGAWFAFAVRAVESPSGGEVIVRGVLVYEDEEADVQIFGWHFDRLAIDGDRAELEGTARVNGAFRPILVTIEDHGSPGRNDRFGIEVLEPGGHANGPSALTGGNIRIH